MNATFRGHPIDASTGKVDMKAYKRQAMVEPLRQFCRIADFVLLLVVLRIQKRLPAFSELRKATLVELGPGPTRLAYVKELFFQRVLFFDQSDFGIPCQGLRIVNLDRFEDAEKIVTDICGLSSNERVFLFADHCMEHLSEDALSVFFKSAIENRFLACFRVPNVLSPGGRRNFLNDSTHHTSFDSALRNRIEQMGFAIFPWIRWYKLRLIFSTLTQREPAMSQAEEIAICTCRRSDTNEASHLPNPEGAKSEA
jgi:hypothetical protein